MLKKNENIDRRQPLPINEDGIANLRLISCKPFLQKTLTTTDTRKTTPDTWQDEWIREELGVRQSAHPSPRHGPP